MRQLLLILPIALLAACSASPSDRDIRGAIERQQAERKQTLTSLLGERGAAMAGQLMGPGEIKSVKKIGCREDGENAWRCDIELQIAAGDATQTRVGQLRLVRSSSGWAVSE